MSQSQRKIDVEKVVAECRAIADQYVRNWNPLDKDWNTLEGAAYLRLSTDEQVLVEKGSLEQQVVVCS